MKLLFDENFELSVVGHFRQLGYDCRYIAEGKIGLQDKAVLATALREKRILITNDLDFGQLVFRHGLSHAGIILFRLPDQSAATKIKVLRELFETYAEALDQAYTVIDQGGIRIRSQD